MNKLASQNKQAILAGKIEPGMSFSEKVWALTARIPRGRITTYGQIARALDCKGARAVGMALNRNPYAPAVPCHRVVGSTGNLTGFAGGIPKKKQLLIDEGVTLHGEKAGVQNVYTFED